LKKDQRETYDVQKFDRKTVSKRNIEIQEFDKKSFFYEILKNYARSFGSEALKKWFPEIGLYIRTFCKEISMEKDSGNTVVYRISVLKPH
jgi:hypothetical protein